MQPAQLLAARPRWRRFLALWIFYATIQTCAVLAACLLVGSFHHEAVRWPPAWFFPFLIFCAGLLACFLDRATARRAGRS